MFDGRHAEACGPEALRACLLERLHDLHSALRESRIDQFVLYPQIAGRSLNRRELARLRQAGIQAVLLQSQAPAPSAPIPSAVSAPRPAPSNWARPAPPPGSTRWSSGCAS
ncbi:hypothetical protein GCM10027514_39090 [Azotobacter armeniacus]